MKCPYCGFSEDKVVDSRVGKDGTSIRRRRECGKCQKRFTTYEYIEPALTVIKRDGRREPFSREKILAGILIAARKRPISIDDIHRIVDEVETSLSDLRVREVHSDKIGEQVMQRLKTLDDVTYIRFASVYLGFKDIHELIEEVENLLKKR